MADDLRDRAGKALLPFFGDGVFGTPELLALVEAHARQAQAEALREAARMEVKLSDPRMAHWFSAEADGVRAASNAWRDALRARHVGRGQVHGDHVR